MNPRARPGLLHRLLLRLHPTRFREEYGAAVEEMIATRAEEALRRGAWGVARFWVRETLGLAASLVRERWTAGGAGSGAGILREPGPSGFLIIPEVKQAARRLARAPAFSSAAVLTLALAIGANTTIYAVARGVLLSPLPYPESEQLVFLDHGSQTLGIDRGLGMTSDFYRHYRDRASTLEAVAIHQAQRMSVSGDGEPEQATVLIVSPSISDVLRVEPSLGRWFSAAEGEVDAPAVAMLSYGLWERRFGAAADVLGKNIVLNGIPHEIVGVMPRGFAFPESTHPDVWVPLRLAAHSSSGFNFTGVARLRNGAVLTDLIAEQDRLIAQLPERFPDPQVIAFITVAKPFASSTSLKDSMVGSVEQTLWTLLGAAGIVFLIACANVANLFLVRTEGRQRELAVRRALGASRGAVPALLLSEAGLLALAGGVAGLALTTLSVKALVSYGPQDLPRLGEVTVDPHVAAFALGMSLLSTLVFGSVPFARRSSLPSSLHEQGRGNTASGARMRARNLLVGTQIALSLMLLVAAGLMARSFQRLRAVDPGFDSKDALVFDVALPPNRYSWERGAAFHDQVLERLRATPGVVYASAGSCRPFSGYCFGDPIEVEGSVRRDGEVPPVVSMRRVASDYFETMGMAPIRGRLFDATDHRSSTKAIVVDERFAELYFPSEDAIGRHISPEFHAAATPDWYTIVGVVPHVAMMRLASGERPPQLYLPLRSHTVRSTPSTLDVSYVVRTTTPPLGLAPAVREVLAQLDDAIPMGRITTLEDMLARDRGPMAFTMVLIVIAGASALALGLVGIYGVISYAVSQRTGEIGVRIALGAQPGDVSRMILRQGTFVATSGLVVGLVGAVTASRFMEALLFQMSPTDPATYASVAAGLLVVSLLACWLPARRAARLDPVRGLRSE